VAGPKFKSGNYCATGMVAIVPSDTTDLPVPCRGMIIGGGGNVVCQGPEGDLVTLKNLPSGALLPVQIVRVKSAGTTATDLVGLF